MAKRRRKPQQLTFDDARKPDGKHGGWRPGAGRPKGRNSVAHRTRERFSSRSPVLVTWRCVGGLPSLRSDRYAAGIFDAIGGAHTTRFRVTDFSVQTNHLHAIVEADGADVLGEAMHRLAGRIVRRTNAAMGRKGQLFDERYHAHVLRTPREVRNALRYVLNNARRHAAKDHYFFAPDWIDPYSSGPHFDGWRDPPRPPRVRCVTLEPRTWLRRVGWRRWGLIEVDDIPGD